MSTYVGVLGNLIAVPDFGDRVQATLSTPTVVHQLAGRGGNVVDRVGVAKWVYSLSVSGMTQDELSVWESLYLGAYGPGPFVLLDPWRLNLLTPNQSSGTDVLMDTTGFTPITGTLTSSTAQSDHGGRSLAWAVTAANQEMITGSLASNSTVSATNDIPVLPSVSYSAQLRGRLSASTGSVKLAMRWFDIAGVFISASSSTVALSNSAFTSVTVSAASPSNAVLVRLHVQNTAMGAAQTIYLDKWGLAMAAAAPAWTVGTGVPRVSFTGDFPQTYPVHPTVSGSITLQEV